MNGVDQRKGTDGAAGTPGAGGGAAGGVGKRTLVDSAPAPAAAAPAAAGAAPAGAGPQAEGGHAHDGEAPDVGAAGGAPHVEGSSTKDGPLSKEKAKQVLQDAFSEYKTISEGKVEVLEQAEFQKAYDKIYGSTKFSWEKWVKPT